MATTKLLGPVIAGMPAGYPRYWSVEKQKSTVRRKMPRGFALLRPTYFTSSTERTVTEADFLPSGESSPYYGSRGPNPSYFPQSLRSSLEAQTMSKLREKIKGEKWNLSTFLGELPETQKYLRGAVKEVVGLYSAVKRGKFNRKALKRLANKGRSYLRKRGIARSVSEQTKNLSGRWLEYRYAICPLIYDLDDMLGYLYRATSRPIVSRVASGGRESWARTLGDGVNSPLIADTGSLQARAVCYFSVNPKAEAFKQLGLINLGATLWELTPLSFVVDMFLPVGDKISQLDAMAGVTVIGASYSTILTMNCTRLPFVRPKGSRTYGGSVGHGSFYSRKAADLSVNFAFTNSPTGKQLVDILALARNILFK